MLKDNYFFDLALINLPFRIKKAVHTISNDMHMEILWW